jgi:hypothetical protein
LTHGTEKEVSKIQISKLDSEIEDPDPETSSG